jgi:hypothetical protein
MKSLKILYYVFYTFPETKILNCVCVQSSMEKFCDKVRDHTIAGL